MPKDVPSKNSRFNSILSKLMKTPTGLDLKGGRTILPEILQQEAIELAHAGGHPRLMATERWLRLYLFFHKKWMKVNKCYASHNIFIKENSRTNKTL